MSDEKLKDLRGGVARMREVAQLLNGWAEDMERSLAGNAPNEPVAVPPERSMCPADLTVALLALPPS